MKTAECVSIESRKGVPEGAAAAPAQFAARVEQAIAAGWRLRADHGPVLARRAAGCLLRPKAGDRVLVFAERDEAWILSVLDRTGAGERVIETDGPMGLRCRSGNISIHAEKCVEVRGDEAIELRSARLGVRAAVTRLVSKNVTWLCDRCEGRFNVLRLVGRACEGLFDRFRQRARTSIREVETLDRVHSGEIDYRAEANLSLEARNLLSRAEHLARIDGDQIHLG